MTGNKRLDYLEQLVSVGKADSFARYALALEYEKAHRGSDAIATFEALRAADPDYLPMYFMAGRLLSTEGQPGRGVEWLKAGLELARRKGDAKAANELAGLLDEVSARADLDATAPAR